jgi:hypothetical protein
MSHPSEDEQIQNVTHSHSGIVFAHRKEWCTDSRCDVSELENVTPSRRLTAGHQGLPPVILATQEIDIRRIVVPSQFGQTVHETLS